jgi:hypothetical protein
MWVYVCRYVLDIYIYICIRTPKHTPKCTRAETRARSSRSRAHSCTDYSLTYSLTDYSLAYATTYSLTDARADSLANGRYDIVIGSHVHALAREEAAVCSRAFAGVRASVVPGPA